MGTYDSNNETKSQLVTLHLSIVYNVLSQVDCRFFSCHELSGKHQKIEPNSSVFKTKDIPKNQETHVETFFFFFLGGGELDKKISMYVELTSNSLDNWTSSRSSMNFKVRGCESELNLSECSVPIESICEHRCWIFGNPRWETLLNLRKIYSKI